MKELVLNGRKVRCELARKDVKNVNIRVGRDCVVRVSAPRRCPAEEVMRVLYGREKWILAALDRFNAAGYPVLIGASRKRFVGSLLAGAGVTEPDMASKDNATAAISALCAEHGVWAVRVHDVAKSRDAVAVGNAWREYANA